MPSSSQSNSKVLCYSCLQSVPTNAKPYIAFDFQDFLTAGEVEASKSSDGSQTSGNR